MGNLSTIKIFSSRIEAEIAKGFLKSYGIETLISADDVGEMYPSQQSVYGVKLMVNKNDLPNSIKLLKKKDLL